MKRDRLAVWMPPTVGQLRVAPARAAWLWGNLVVGCVWGLPALTRTSFGVAIGLAFVTLCMGHSVGLHRGEIHRSYTAPAWMRGVLATCFVFSGLGGPLDWARLHAHRDYWQNRADCPRYFAYDHGLACDFWLNLHLRFVPADPRAALRRLPPDVLGNRWLAFLQRTWPLYSLALFALVGWRMGAVVAAVTVCLRIAVSIVGHWFVGYAAHTWGSQPHQVPGARESGTNVWLLGVLSFGEGFHNNHHVAPHAPRMGRRWYEFDLGYLCLRALRGLGFVRF